MSCSWYCRCSWCVSMSGFLHGTVGSGLLMVKYFQEKKMELEQLNKYWFINKEFCLGYLYVLEKFPLSKNSPVHGRILYQTQTLWNAPLWCAGPMLNPCFGFRNLSSPASQLCTWTLDWDQFSFFCHKIGAMYNFHHSLNRVWKLRYHRSS